MLSPRGVYTYHTGFQHIVYERSPTSVCCLMIARHVLMINVNWLMTTAYCLLLNDDYGGNNPLDSNNIKKGNNFHKYTCQHGTLNLALGMYYNDTIICTSLKQNKQLQDEYNFTELLDVCRLTCSIVDHTVCI